MTSLTNHLPHLDTKIPYASATQHPFLRSAGERTLAKDLLALWLFQDRIYAAHAYPRFIGALLTKVPFSSSDSVDSPAEKQNQRIVGLLSFALDNIVKEVGFFDDVSTKWGLDISVWDEREGTRNYTAEMARIGALCTLEEGLVFLWAMEKVYLDAWSFADSVTVTKSNQEEDTTSSALSAFISNWTSDGFKSFVRDLETLVNDIHIDKQQGSIEWKRAERIWERVIELEKGFWPEFGEDQIQKQK